MHFAPPTDLYELVFTKPRSAEEMELALRQEAPQMAYIVQFNTPIGAADEPVPVIFPPFFHWFLWGAGFALMALVSGFGWNVRQLHRFRDARRRRVAFEGHVVTWPIALDGTWVGPRNAQAILDPLLGDLEEMYLLRLEAIGWLRANVWYLSQMARTIAAFLLVFIKTAF